MPIIIHSPYSGREVKIRDQDVGRAVRDEENRIFYVLERADGSGHYAAPTRAGNPREEQRYDELVAKIAQTRASGQLNSERQVHDAMGTRRANPMLRLIVLVLVLLIAAGVVAYFTDQLNQFFGTGRQPAPGGGPVNVPQQPAPGSAPALPDNAPPVPSTQGSWLQVEWGQATAAAA